MSKFEKGKSGSPATQFQKGNNMQKAKGYEQAKTIMKRVLAMPYDDNPGITVGEAIVFALTQKALGGDTNAINIVYDRLYGKPKASVDIASTFQHNLRYKTVDELELMIKQIENGQESE